MIECGVDGIGALRNPVVKTVTDIENMHQTIKIGQIAPSSNLTMEREIPAMLRVPSFFSARLRFVYNVLFLMRSDETNGIFMATKSDLAYELLRDSIIAGDIPPDLPLRIQSLGEETGYGSTPVREALRRLEANGLVVSEVNRGFRSAPISLVEMKDLERCRLVVETALLKDSIECGVDRWESEVVAAHYQLSKLSLPMDTADRKSQFVWAEKHQQFHDALIAASPSKWLQTFQRQITEQLVRIFHFTMDEKLLLRLQESEELRSFLRQSHGIEHHTLLMKASLDRDVERATSILADHIQFATMFFSRIEA